MQPIAMAGNTIITGQRTNAQRTPSEIGGFAPRRYRRLPAPVRSRALFPLLDPEPESETAFHLRNSYDIAARLRRAISE